MPQTIIQYTKELDNKLIQESKRLQLSKADTIIEIIKKYFGGFI